MPARNAESTIEDSIKSVLACPQVTELIIVDDGSSDGTKSIAERLCESNGNIKYLPGPQKGISAALNVGIMQSSSPYLARCDSDDFFEKGRFDWQLSFLKRNPNYVAICSGFVTIDENSRTIAQMSLKKPSQEITQTLLSGEVTTHFGTWLLRSNAAKEIGGAREWFESAEDIDLQFRLAEKGKVWQEQKISYRYRLHSQSITHSMVSARREFFDQYAREFALQRRRGEDDLTKGSPPQKPAAQKGKAIKTSAKHIAGLLQGDAWRLLAEGKRSQGFRKICWALKLQPANLSLWVNLIQITVKKQPN